MARDRDDTPVPEFPEATPVDADQIKPLAPEGDPAVEQGRRGDPEDTSLEPSDQSEDEPLDEDRS